MGSFLDAYNTAKPQLYSNGPAPTPQANPALAKVGPTNMWARLAQQGVQKIENFAKETAVDTGKAFKGTAQGVTRMLPGGMNDLNAQEKQSAQADQNTRQALGLEKAGKISKAAGTALTLQSANQSSAADINANKTFKSIPTTEQFAGDIAQVGSFAIPGAGKAAEVSGSFLLKQLGEQGVKEVAAKVGIDASKQSIEDTAEQVVKTKAGQKVAQVIAKGGTSTASRALKSAGIGAVTGGVNAGGQGASQNESATGVVKSAAVGALTGAALGTAASGIKTMYKGATGKTDAENALIKQSADHQQNLENAKLKPTNTPRLPAGEIKTPTKELPQGSTTKGLPAPKPTNETTTSSFTIPKKNVGSANTSGVFGTEAKKAGAQASVKQSRLDMMQQIDDKLSKLEQGKTIMSSSDRQDLFKTRQALASGNKDTLIGKDLKTTVTNVKNDSARGVVKATPTASEKLRGASVPASAAEASSKPDASFTQRVMKATAPPVEKEPLVNTNKPVKSLIDKFTPKSLKGKLNPVDSAARQGHTTFANTARDIAGNKIYALRQGNNISNQFDKVYADYLAGGGTHQKFISDIESGKLGSQAHELWNQIHTQTGKDLAENNITKGARSNYVGRVARFEGNKSGLGGSGLSKSGPFSKARTQISDEYGISRDQYSSHAEFKKAVEANGGQVLSDPRDILRHTLPAKLEAIENAKGLAQLDKTAMADGRAATATFDPSKSLPRELIGYNKDILQGRAVHPGAVNTVDALSHTYTQKELNSPVAKANSMAKQIITLNGLIHGKNFGLASLRKQGAIHTVQAMLKTNKDLADTFGEDNIKRAITKGGVVPFEQNKQDMFDTLSNPKSNKTWDTATSFPGKAIGKERVLLFNKLGNHLQFSTYFNVEKQMLKAGLNPDEAARVAGSSAKNVSFISSPVETSVEYHKGARFIFFAGQYFKSTLNEAAKAAGISRDVTLSGAAQRQAQKQAIVGIARGMAYLTAIAQGISYKTTGHSTFQNKDIGNKLSPVFYVDKATGKEYHISNWYGQLGDMMNILGNPVKEMTNKISPMIQGITKVVEGISGGTDPYTGQKIIDTTQPGWNQTLQAAGKFLETMVSPFGFSISNTQGPSTPSAVTFAKLLGYGASSVDQNTLEKDIANQYYATLPAGGGAQKSQQLINAEQVARNDLSKGIKNSQALSFVQSNSTPASFKKFMSTGASTTTQREYDALSTAAKLQLIEKYPNSQLKELDLSGIAKTLVGTSQKTTITSLEAKGFTPARIARDMQKIGYSQSQLQTIRAEAKRQASVTAKKSAHEPKFVNPLL